MRREIRKLTSDVIMTSLSQTDDVIGLGQRHQKVDKKRKWVEENWRFEHLKDHIISFERSLSIGSAINWFGHWAHFSWNKCWKFQIWCQLIHRDFFVTIGRIWTFKINDFRLLYIVYDKSMIPNKKTFHWYVSISNGDRQKFIFKYINIFLVFKFFFRFCFLCYFWRFDMFVIGFV